MKRRSLFVSLTLIIISIFIIIVITGCNRPMAIDVPATAAANTAIASTVQAALTRAAPSPTPLIIPTATVTSIPCINKFTFIDDITVQDEDDFSPGVTFIKTWRVKNVGTCTWTTAYSLAFYQDNAMGGPASVPLSTNVPPGQTIDLSVNLVAPSTTGRYTGKWAIKDQNGVFFFSTLGNPIWVIIDVVSPSSGN